MDFRLFKALECVSSGTIRKFEWIFRQFKEETRRLSSAKSSLVTQKLRTPEFLRHTLSHHFTSSVKAPICREQLCPERHSTHRQASNDLPIKSASNASPAMLPQVPGMPLFAIARAADYIAATPRPAFRDTLYTLAAATCRHAHRLACSGIIC